MLRTLVMSCFFCCAYGLVCNKGGELKAKGTILKDRSKVANETCPDSPQQACLAWTGYGVSFMGESERSSFAYGSCVNASLCQNSCHFFNTSLRKVNPFAKQAPNTECTSSCCTTDNCNTLNPPPPLPANPTANRQIGFQFPPIGGGFPPIGGGGFLIPTISRPNFTLPFPNHNFQPIPTTAKNPTITTAATTITKIAAASTSSNSDMMSSNSGMTSSNSGMTSSNSGMTSSNPGVTSSNPTSSAAVTSTADVTPSTDAAATSVMTSSMDSTLGGNNPGGATTTTAGATNLGASVALLALVSLVQFILVQF